MKEFRHFRAFVGSRLWWNAQLPRYFLSLQLPDLSAWSIT